MSFRKLISGALLTVPPSLLFASGATAASTSFEKTGLNLTSTPSHAAASSGGSLVRTIVGLFIVMAVIYGLAWVLKQVKKGKTRASGTGLSSVANLPLGKDRSLSLVRVGRDFVLLGVAEGSVRMIRTYSEDEAIELGVDPYADDEAEAHEAITRPAGTLVEQLRRLTVRS